jgi:hypothetical protein
MLAPELSPPSNGESTDGVSISASCVSSNGGKPISSVSRMLDSAEVPAGSEFGESRAKEDAPHNTTTVQRGFGGFKVDTTGVFNDKIPCYPPPSNAYYQHSIHQATRDHTNTFIPSIDATALVRQSIPQNIQEQERVEVERSRPNIGEIEAQKIDWARATYSDEGYGDLIFGDITPCRAEFVKMINDEIDRGNWPFDMCTVCGKQHIPWGAPIHLQDRDTCYSMLPKWFPAEEFEKPWDALRTLINHIIKLKERERDRLADTAKKPWELEYHEPSAAWKTAGRNGGWWKCRGGNNAPTIEKMCQLCHRPRTAEEPSREELHAKEKMLIDAATKWIDELEVRQMQKDIEVCDERYRRQGYY